MPERRFRRVGLTKMLEQTSFATWWPAADARVRAVLLANRVPASAVDDYVQTTAERALRGNNFASEEHFIGWCVVVAKNLFIDDIRKRRRELICEVPDRGVDADLAERVADGIALDALRLALRDLTPIELALLNGTTGSASDRRGQVRDAVERHRIRKRLRRGLEGLAAAFARGPWAVHKARAVAVTLTSPTALAASALVAIAAIAMLGSVADRDTDDEVHNSQAAVTAAAHTNASSNETRPEVMTVASESSPRPSESRSVVPPIARVSLGTDAAGDERFVDVRDQQPDERGILYCGGLSADHPVCIYWPKAITDRFNPT